MNIEKDKVVSMNYTLKNDQGEVLDTSDGREALAFIYGNGMIIPGLEKEMKGKAKGDSFSVTIPPAEGYGEYDEEAFVSVSKDNFQQDMELEVGMPVQAQQSDGSVQHFYIKQVADDTVTLDANHPLAGETLHFDVSIEDVRDASAEELDHGHVH